MGGGQDRPIPPWAWALIAALALLQPLVHAWIRYAPPEGTVPTGLHITDSALFLHSLGMFDSGFASPYATCQAPEGDRSVRYYSVPHLWVYGALGAVGRLLGADEFLLLGVANGLGAALYLTVALLLLRAIDPRRAGPAFVLFALSAGPGGLLYVLAGALGWHGVPAFETYFTRFALYDLMEGPHCNPALYYCRLYYTVSLALCLGALWGIVRAARGDAPRAPLAWAVPLALGAFINARYGLFTLALAGLFLWQHGGAAPRRARLFLAHALPTAAGCLASFALMRTNPAVVDNHRLVGNMAMWFSPFVAAAGVHLLLAAGPLFQGLRRGDRAARLLLAAGLGYLAAYAAGYLLYQAYYGGLLTGRDGSVAAVVSDPALLGGLAGVAALLARRRAGEKDDGLTWVRLWFIGFLAVSLSGFAGGRFLALGPQRLQVFLWLPLCLFAARGLAGLRPWLARPAWGWLLVCGVTGVLVATFAFQGSAGRRDARGPYARVHPEVIREADLSLTDAIGDGTVLTPNPMGDAVVRMRGNPVVFGTGSFNLTTVPFLEVSGDVEAFFDAATHDGERRAIAAAWCADYVLCPATWPVDTAVREALDEADWLVPVARSGDGALYRVTGTGGRPAGVGPR